MLQSYPLEECDVKDIWYNASLLCNRGRVIRADRKNIVDVSQEVLQFPATAVKNSRVQSRAFRVEVGRQNDGKTESK